MSNLESIVNNTKKLITKSYLKDEFRRIGIQEGDCLLVHSALSKLGFVCGGEVAVVEALIEVVGEDGTIVMPTHSGDYVDPIFWGNPPVPNEWFEDIRKEMPVFNPDVTPTFGMGRIVECFRNIKGVKRSYHPTVSFAAFGKHADFITKNHSLEYSLGENSPLARFYELDGKVLLIGVDYDSNTSFHLSEYRAGNYSATISASPVIENGERLFKSYEDIEFKTELFMFAGEEFEENNNVKIDKIGNADIKIFNQRDCVDFGVKYFKECTLY
ncbi:aminoglycoside N(3)-acetyltransferase [Clostridium sardiniense]|uniref:aminoglycoside N(3)-acetyltransferase n=1 Tax=Clostridium sardiniense TaxID=29369 RepID=UPI00195B26B8|nr:AAC(3) family N-acetyltransferase [Clostridium sardiniense]MBM7836369.1 aminoglycoside 3-N-acetyltransferase [Clostridium sardiniense]